MTTAQSGCVRPSRPRALSRASCHGCAGAGVCFELREALAHVLERLPAHIELAGLASRPKVVDALSFEIGDPPLRRENPITDCVAHVDVVLAINQRNHLVPDRTPDFFGGELRK